VAFIIKAIAAKLDIDPVMVSSHSLRADFITDQCAAGKAEAEDEKSGESPQR